MSNPYKVLGVSPSASHDEIKSAYRNFAKKFHPDLNPGDKTAEARFKEINAAYELVGTPESRAKFERGESEAAHAQRQHRSGPFYNETQSRGGRYSQGPGSEMDEDMLRSIFEQMGRGGEFRDHPNRRGQDILYQMDVSFRDAALGGEREIGLPGGKKIRVTIPAGVNSGAKLKFAGLGEAGMGQSPAGDAYVQLNVLHSPLFKREGHDLEIDLPISISEAILGAEIKVPTIDGHVFLKIPSGVSSGKKFRLTGKGILNSSTGKRGDQFVVLKLVCPPNVDPEIKQAVDAWNQRQAFDARADWAGLQGGA
jgi:DnaJ-class molecular chaperone